MKNLAHKGAKQRSVLVKNKNAILRLGFFDPNLEKANEDLDRVDAETARLKRDKSSSSSEGGIGSW